MITVTSHQNQYIKQFRALHAAKGRREAGLYLAEGARLVGEALCANAPIRMAAVDGAQVNAFQTQIAMLEAQGVPVLLCENGTMQKVCDAVTPQGIAVAIALPKAQVQGNRMVALDGVADPGNVGTILRTAQAFGCETALFGGGADPFSPKCVRAGMGAHFRMQLMSVNLPHTLCDLRMQGFAVVGGHLDGAPQPPHDLPPKTVCVIGSEAFGMTEDVRCACTHLWRIPMPGGAESLNAAVAAGILLYATFCTCNENVPMI